MTAALRIGRRDQRTLGVGVVTIGLLMSVARGIPAIRAWEADRLREARETATQLASIRVGRRQLSALRDSLAARRARLASVDSTLLSGASTSAIAAALASSLEDQADRNAMKITALQIRADSVARGGMTRVDVRLSGITDVVGLAGLLQSVEGGAMPLVIRELDVSQPEPAAADNRAEALHIDVLVSGVGLVKGDRSVGGK
ncbi:MAG TPA: GspMb/PilO family protein [Gemmatimonadaceae bacterium]|nr:GspMb/PilO family protein [Gemmatimonadaceae bacterium]